MIPESFDYVDPTDLEEVVAHLTDADGQARLLAGGHSLLPRMKLRQERPGLLVDLRRDPDLHGVQDAADRVVVGAMTTHAQVERSAELAATVPLLSRAAEVLSDPLIRNRGTIGGSLAEADPRGDWPAVALALDATVRLYGPGGSRTVPVEQLFVDAHRTVLGTDEVLTAVELPRPDAATLSTYLKRTDPASGFAVVGVAVTLLLDDDGRCRDCRVGLTAAGRVPSRAVGVEQRLRGRVLDDAAITDAAAAVTEGLEVRADDAASADYRAHLLPIQVARALQAARSG